MTEPTNLNPFWDNYPNEFDFWQMVEELEFCYKEQNGRERIEILSEGR